MVVHRPVRPTSAARGLAVLAVVAVLAGGSCGSGDAADEAAATTTSTIEEGGGEPTSDGAGSVGWVERPVEAGDTTLSVWCQGSGAPTVLFVSGLAEDATSAWRTSPVPDRLAEQSTVCVYDRPGLGASPTTTAARTLDAHAAELGAVAAGVGDGGPVLVVGQGLGTYIARVFAESDMGAVAGLVLLDPPLEDFPSQAPPDASPGQRAEYEAMATLNAGLGAFGPAALPLPPVPVVVLGSSARSEPPPGAGAPTTVAPPGVAAEGVEARQASQAFLASTSPYGRFQAVPDSGPHLQFWAPDEVVAAVESVLADG